MNIPYCTFKTRVLGSWQDVTTDNLFKNKKVGVFALHGAFTPTCSNTHLPGFEAKYDEFLKYVDEIYCVSVNDTFVMNAWAKDLKIEKVKMLPDGNGAFTQGIDMLVNKQHLGFGKRSWRYSAIIDNGQLTKMFAEPGKNDNGEDMDPFLVSDANTILKYLQESK